MKNITSDIDPDTACDSALEHIRENILSREGAASVGTLAQAAVHLHKTKNELTRLRGLTDEVDNVILFLRENSHDLTKCTDHVRQFSWWENIWNKGQSQHINGSEKLQDALSKLTQKQGEFRKQIDSIQGKLDTIAWAVIFINVVMVLEGVRTYIADEAKVAEFGKILDEMVQKIEKYKGWFESSNKTERERNHFWQKVQECNVELIRIETEVMHLRKSNVTRAVTSVTVGLGTVAMAWFLPTSVSMLYGMVFSGLANAGSSTLNIRLVGKIDELMPLISNIRTLVGECRSMMYQESSDLPNFD